MVRFAVSSVTGQLRIDARSAGERKREFFKNKKSATFRHYKTVATLVEGFGRFMRRSSPVGHRAPASEPEKYCVNERGFGATSDHHVHFLVLNHLHGVSECIVAGRTR